MKKVKLNRDWKSYKEGRVLTRKDRPFYTLEFLIRQGWAIDLSDDQHEVPTIKNTKKEIEAYLDQKGIEYGEYLSKADLLELCT